MTYDPRFSDSVPTVAVEGIGLNKKNSSGGTLQKATPVRIDGNGELQTIDVSAVSEVLSTVGLTQDSINDTETGIVLKEGAIYDISNPFNFGDILYISKTGGLTNVTPEIGVGGFVDGDFVIRAGIVAKNSINPAQKDIIVSLLVVGQL